MAGVDVKSPLISSEFNLLRNVQSIVYFDSTRPDCFQAKHNLDGPIAVPMAIGVLLTSKNADLMRGAVGARNRPASANAVETCCRSSAPALPWRLARPG